jgi:hypothetical protein
VRLHLDAARLETDERMGDRACEHVSTLRGDVLRQRHSFRAKRADLDVSAPSPIGDDTGRPITNCKRR